MEVLNVPEGWVADKMGVYSLHHADQGSSYQKNLTYVNNVIQDTINLHMDIHIVFHVARNQKIPIFLRITQIH